MKERQTRERRPGVKLEDIRINRGRVVESSCGCCGALFLVRKSAVAQGRGRFCSRSCLAKNNLFKERHRGGASNPNWRGGVSRSEKEARYRSKYPERHAAHRAVRRAVIRGDLNRQPCSVCLSTARIEGHHPDYSRPLHVIWLCKPCHMAHHKLDNSGLLG